MAKKFYCSSSGLSKEVKKFYASVEGESAKVVKAYCSENGLSKLFYTSNKPEWRRLDNAPINGYLGAACVYKDEIHLINGTSHYAFDGQFWRSVSTYPASVSSPGIVSDGNYIYVLSYGVSNNSYKWDGVEWTQLPSPNIYFSGFNNACDYGGVTLVSSSSGNYDFAKKIRRLQGSNWSVEGNTINQTRLFRSCCVYDGDIHYSGASVRDNGTTIHAVWDGSSNEALEPVPYGFYEGCMVTHLNNLHFIGSKLNTPQDGGNCTKKHYIWTGSEYKEESVLPEPVYLCPAVSFNQKLYLFGTANGTAGDYYSRVYVYE